MGPGGPHSPGVGPPPGGSTVIAAACIAHRLDLARSRGAAAVNFDEEDVLDRLKELTDGRGPDVCIEAVGASATSSLYVPSSPDEAG